MKIGQISLLLLRGRYSWNTDRPGIPARYQEYRPGTEYPYGGCAGIVERLARSGRLSAQTLGPLLRSWSFVEEHEEQLGAPLAYAAATCPAIASVAARLLVHQSSKQKIVALPDGTRKAIAVGSSDDR